MAKGYLTPFQKLRFEDLKLNQVVESASVVFTDITSRDIISGEYLSNVPIKTTKTLVSHGLQRPVKGWIVVKRNANSSVWDLESANTQQAQFLALIASANVTVSLWVF